MKESELGLIDAAVAPLEGDDELQLVARQQLGGIVDPDAPEDVVREATKALQKGKSALWKWGGLAMVILLSLPMLYWLAVKGRGGVVRVLSELNVIMPSTAPDEAAGGGWQNKLSEQERLLLFGKKGATSQVATWRPLWESDPENPAFYQEYLLSFRLDRRPLPADVIETGQRIDPGNGWYRLRMATEDLDTVVEIDSPARSASKAGAASSYRILDEEEFRERLALLHAACREPRLESHVRELARQRFELVPPAVDFVSMTQAYLVTASQRFDVSSKDVWQLVAAEAQRCQRENDREGFLELSKTWRRLAEAKLDEGYVLIDALLAQAFLTGTLPSMRDAAQALDVHGEDWAALEKAVRERKETLSARKTGNQVITQHGSFLGSLTLPMVNRFVEDIPPLTVDDLRPSVRVDQALLGRLLSGLGWLVLGLVVVSSLGIASGSPKVIKVLARRFRGLLGIRDWMWILVGGVGVPLLLFLGIRYGTPLARLDWGPRLTLYAVPMGHFVALLLMWLVWPVVIAAWRFERCGQVFGWSFRKRIAAGLAMASPVIGMVLLGLGVPMGGHSLVLFGLACALGLYTLIWGVLRPGCGGEKGFGRKLQRGTLASATRPAWLTAMVTFALLSPFFAAEERRWMARDEILKPTPSMSSYEERVTQQVVKELRQLLEDHPIE